MTDARLLRLSRLSVLVVAIISLSMALLRSNIYELVSESSALSLVSLFVPLVAGMFWRKTSSTAAVASMLAGMSVWLLALYFAPEVNPMLYGLAGSVAGLFIGQVIGEKLKLKKNTFQKAS